VEVCLRKALTILENGVGVGKAIKIGAIRVIGGPYLNKHSIMVQHYGVIAKISKEGETAISAAAREVLRVKFAEDIGSWTPEYYKSHVLGGHQFLQKFPQFNAFSLLAMNDNLTIIRLGPGTYAIKIKVRGEPFIVLNSFHPYQVVPYNSAGNAIIVFECSSSSSWAELRNLAGPTDPTTAPEGSIRRAFLNAKAECGLIDVDRGSNCVHMSAGPLEGMVELQRFFSDLDTAKIVPYDHTAFGALLLGKGFSHQKLSALAENPDAEAGGKKQSVFDLTEEKDALEALTILEHSKLL